MLLLNYLVMAAGIAFFTAAASYVVLDAIVIGLARARGPVGDRSSRTTV